METFRIVGAIAVCLLLLMMNSCQDQEASEEMTKFRQGESLKAANIELAKAFCRHVDGGNLDSCRALFSADAKIYYESGEPVSFGDMEPLTKTFYTSFPDYKHDIEDIIAAGDKVVVRISYSGTFAKTFMDIKPNGAKFKYKGIHVFQFTNNRVVNFWGVEDELGMMTQLGLELRPKK